MIKTEKYYFKDIPKKCYNKNICNIIVFNGDCFEAEKIYDNLIIHNFANNIRPGGPTSKFNKNGILEWQKENSNTQEDQIIRRYKNKLLLYPQMYPICNESVKNGEALLYSNCNDLPGGKMCIKVY